MTLLRKPLLSLALVLLALVASANGFKPAASGNTARKPTTAVRATATTLNAPKPGQQTTMMPMAARRKFKQSMKTDGSYPNKIEAVLSSTGCLACGTMDCTCNRI